MLLLLRKFLQRWTGEQTLCSETATKEISYSQQRALSFGVSCEQTRKMSAPSSATKIVDAGNLTRKRSIKRTLKRSFDDSHCRYNISIVTGLFGGYDELELERLPECMTGVVYTDQSGLRAQTRRWTVRYLKLHETKFASSARLSSKRVKFASFQDFSSPHVSAVLYRDMNVRLHNISNVFSVLERMVKTGTELLLRDWDYPRAAIGKQRIWWEINDMLTRRSSHVSRSKANVMAWRDMLRSTGIQFHTYAEGNLMMYMPHSSTVQRIFRGIFQTCHVIERDQFIIPFFILNETGVKVNRWLAMDLGAKKVGHKKRHDSLH